MLTIRNMLSEIVIPNMYLVVKKKWSKSEVMEKFPLDFLKALRSLCKPMLVHTCSLQTRHMRVHAVWWLVSDVSLRNHRTVEALVFFRNTEDQIQR